MGKIKIKKGLNLPISGEPEQKITAGNNVTSVALMGFDYVNLKPTFQVQVGDKVKLGQILFLDKKHPEIKFTSPGAGTIAEINRGEKRVFLSVVIKLEGKEEITFNSYSENDINNLTLESVKNQLLDSGLWTAIRERPFSKVADPSTQPHSIFVTAMDSNPLAPSVEVILNGNERNFENGLKIISKLAKGKVFVCKYDNSKIDVPDLTNIYVEEFSGPHPAGLVGTHIHFLDPVSRNKKVWYLNLQDVIAIGYLFTSGKIYTDKVISLAGPMVKNPRLLKTRIGANLEEITKGELEGDNNRIISGSVLSGRKISEAEKYLGRFHQQVSVISENVDRDFLGWMLPKSKYFSIKKVTLSSLSPKKKFDFNAALNGGERAIVPIGSYEKVMPLDILPTYLLRSLAVNDIEEAEKLGCLELDEEDLALCTLVCPSKIDHGFNLRRNLNIIEKEG